MIVVSKQKNGFMLKVYTFEQISFFVAILVNIKQACVIFYFFPLKWNHFNFLINKMFPDTFLF